MIIDIIKISFILISITLSSHSIDFSWKQLDNEGTIPLGAAGSSIVFLDDKLILFGGVEECFNTTAGPNNTIICAGNLFFNDIYIYDLDNNHWSKPTTNGPKPAARAFHRSVAHSDTNTMYMYGGVIYASITGVIFTPLGDFWKFDLDTLTWTLINNTNPPGIRVDPGLVISDDLIYLGFGLSSLGGTPEQNNRNDLWNYNVNTGQWTLLIANNPFNRSQPPVRYQAKFDFNQKYNLIFLYGGDVLPDNTRSLDDTWIYDIKENQWQFRDNNSMIPLFTGISATYGDIFLLSTGEERGGVQVECVDPVSGRSNNPVNKHYLLQFPIDGSTYYELNLSPSILPVMQSAYTLHRDTLYAWGGFNFFCVRSGFQGTSSIRALVRFFNNVWTLQLPRTVS